MRHMKKRSCGVLLPVSALPSKYGIGTLGRAAYQFVDFLKSAGQEYWQILPLVPTGYGDSPYQSVSTFAGNPYMIDLEMLIADGLLEKEECESIDWGENPQSVDYLKLYENRFALLEKAFERSRCADDPNYAKFKNENAYWLDDYALFMALKKAFNEKPWQEWDEPIRFRTPQAVAYYQKKLARNIEYWKYVQYLFFSQYRRLRVYANGNGIKIIGDMPIYVSDDSADVWANTKLFQLDERLNPAFVAGVPPDYFSKTGQLWGNPVYDWDGHKKELFDWWVKRLAANFKLYDVVRIDHFRAFDEYYAIPFGEKTAEYGTWKKGPGIEFFDYVKKHLGGVEIIAEDLGSTAESVRELLRKTGYPSMKVLQFGFDAHDDSHHLPHNYTNNMVVYTGTHDNDTLVGWFNSASESERAYALEYLHIEDQSEFADAAIRALFASTASLAVIPIQDWLGLDGSARMNTPSTVGINWKWRLNEGMLTSSLAERMKRIANAYRRCEDYKLGDAPKAQDVLNDFERILRNHAYTTLDKADAVTVYNCLSQAAMNAVYPMWKRTAEIAAGQKQACYLSAEFLIGRVVFNNLYCMGLLDEVKQKLSEKGFDLNRLEEIDDPALGNGGLGRLAACFVDSAAAHRLPLMGYGIRYRYGLFKQSFENGFQKETADDWTSQGDPWSVRREDERVLVKYADQSVWAVPYDMPVVGYKSGYVSTIRLWQSEPVNPFDFKLFNDQQYEAAVREKEQAERISLVLYPNDDRPEGKKLRIKQEYLLTSASVQDILRRFKAAHGDDFGKLPDYFAVQLNDTHPVMAIPELIRLLTGEGLPFEDAFSIAQKTFAFTNHTVMAEALEKWDVELFRSVLPEIMSIVEKINERLLNELRSSGCTQEEIDRRAIISGNMLHTARLAVYVCFAVNGVAKIHTEILKKDLFKEWYLKIPQKFQNKTNGITQRRWLGLCNPELSAFISGLIGDSWVTDLSQLKNLELFADDTAVLRRFEQIKLLKKRQLADEILKKEGIAINESFIYDVQIKRLHEYKRQLLNALSIVAIYNRLKEGKLPDFHPMVCIFGAKAAPGYFRAKGIIKFINEVARKVNADPETSDRLKVVFVQNYNVSYAEKLIPAADISEQISTAGTEASGTGNMKLMLNGAVTLGTYDGANIEIFEQAGEENNYCFGARVEELERLRKDYDPKKLYQANRELKKAVDSLVDGTFDDGNTGVFKELYKALLEGIYDSADNYFLLYDFDSYLETKLKANRDYKDRLAFDRKCFINVANAGIFSSDRTVREYAKDIWHINPVSWSNSAW